MATVRRAYFCSDIKLVADEEITYRVENSCLIGKIILDWPLHEDDVKSVTLGEWNCKEDYVVSEIKRNVFMFSFQDKEDWKKVLLDGPWTIMRGLLILSPWTASKIPEELQFSYSPFWVQVHGLPINYWTKENGLKIGQFLGMFLSVDWKAFGAEVLWRNFLRIRVVLDIRSPLRTGFWLRRTTLPDLWIELKYEKLGLFCYKCGRIGSHYRNCRFPAGKANFGPWLYAESRSDARDAASSSGAEASMVDARGGIARNACTALVTIPRVEAILIQSSNPEIGREMTPKTSHCSKDTPLRMQRLIMNSIDSVTMIANCAIISSRVAGASEYQSNWKFLMLMTAYFSYLVMKWIRITRKLCFLNSYNGRVTIEEHKFMALLEILILLLFLVMFKSW